MTSITSMRCPLCGHASSKHLHDFDSHAAQIHLGGENISNDSIAAHIEKLWGSSKAEFRICNNCQLTFAVPFMAGDATLYSLIYSSGLNYPKWKWEFEFALNGLKDKYSESQRASVRLLEIGAGEGNFLSRLLKEGFRKENLLSTEYSSHGKNRIEGLGIKCLSSDLQDLCTEDNKEKFDAILLFQVLEHLQDLKAVFDGLNYLLKPNGTLIISVPNNYHREFFEKMGLKEDVPPIHISRWSRGSFQFVENNFKFKIVNFAIEPNSFLKNMSKLLRFKYGTNRLLSYVDTIERRPLRIIAKSLILFPLAFINLHFSSVLMNKKLGISQAIHFKKV